MRPTTIAISGFSSDSGKTTLLCQLLRAFPGWEAIKITRGHYRSCGKDPHACCVSHLLGDQPLIRSGREQTYAEGKDTGRYWEAGASQVHWLIVTEEQVERGIRLALERVQAEGVFIEGTSFLRSMNVDLALMAARVGFKIKPSARRVLDKVSALYLFQDEAVEIAAAREKFIAACGTSAKAKQASEMPIFTIRDLPKIVARIKTLHASVAA